MIVGESPAADDAFGEPFTGFAGQVLDKLLRSAGMSRRDVYLAYAIPSKLPQGSKPTKSVIEKCKPWLWQAIKIVKPRVIITWGVLPSKLLLRGNSHFDLKEVFGKPHPAEYLGKGTVVVPVQSCESLVRKPAALKKEGMGIEETVKVFMKCKEFESRHVGEGY